MANQQQASEALWIVGGVGAIALVAYLASRHQGGNTLQPVAPASPASTTTDTSQGPTATNSMAFDVTALPDPLAGTPTPSASPNGAPAQFVTLSSGSTIPFIAGIEYAFGSIVHFADGTALQVGQNGITMPYTVGNTSTQ